MQGPPVHTLELLRSNEEGGRVVIRSPKVNDLAHCSRCHEQHIIREDLATRELGGLSNAKTSVWYGHATYQAAAQAIISARNEVVNSIVHVLHQHRALQVAPRCSCSVLDVAVFALRREARQHAADPQHIGSKMVEMVEFDLAVPIVIYMQECPRMLPDHVVQSIMNSLGYLPLPQDADNGVKEDEALTVLRSKPPRLHLIHDEGIHQRHHCENIAGPVPNVGRGHEALFEERIGHPFPTPWQVKLPRVSLQKI